MAAVSAARSVHAAYPGRLLQHRVAVAAYDQIHVLEEGGESHIFAIPYVRQQHYDVALLAQFF